MKLRGDVLDDPVVCDFDIVRDRVGLLIVGSLLLFRRLGAADAVEVFVDDLIDFVEIVAVASVEIGLESGGGLGGSADREDFTDLDRMWSIFEIFFN